MNQIQQRVLQARRRMNFRDFVTITAWLMFGFLMVAVIAIAIPKWRPMELLHESWASDYWTIGWITGSVVIAIALGYLVTFLRRPSPLQAAIEVDQRYRLKERLSSAISLDENEAETGAGKALIQDASRRAEALEIKDAFSIRPSRWAVLPFVPLLLIIVLGMFNNASFEAKAEAEQLTPEVRKQLLDAAKKTKMKLKQKKKQLEERGLKELADMMSIIDNKLSDFQKSDLSDRKNALIKLNDIKSDIEEKQKSLGDVKSLKKELSKLAKPNTGAAKELADSLREGDMKNAQDAIKNMIDKMKQGDMSAKDRNEIANELGKMADTLRNAVDKFEEARKQLDSEIERAQQNGDKDKAAKLQAQKDQLESRKKQLDQLKKLADKLQDSADKLADKNTQADDSNPDKSNNDKSNPKKNGQGGDQNASPESDKQSQKGGKQGNGKPQDSDSNSSKNGDSSESGSQSPSGGDMESQMSQAQAALDQLSDQLDELESEMSGNQALQDLADQIGQCKGMMNGLGQMQGDYTGNQAGDKGDGLGSGTGYGDRPITETETGTYESQVRARVTKGETVVTGKADGANVPGVSRESVKQRINESPKLDADALENQKFTKSQREHTKDYFQKIRGK